MESTRLDLLIEPFVKATVRRSAASSSNSAADKLWGVIRNYLYMEFLPSRCNLSKKGFSLIPTALCTMRERRLQITC